jgi:hypothetical protein
MGNVYKRERLKDGMLWKKKVEYDGKLLLFADQSNEAKTSRRKLMLSTA